MKFKYKTLLDGFCCQTFSLKRPDRRNCAACQPAHVL